MLEGCLVLLDLGQQIGNLQVGIEEVVRNEQGPLPRGGEEAVVDHPLGIGVEVAGYLAFGRKDGIQMSDSVLFNLYALGCPTGEEQITGFDALLV